MIRAFRHRLLEPQPGFGTSLEIQANILKAKPALRNVFECFYQQLDKAASRFCNTNGAEIELGSGAGFFKEIRPQVITSDIRESERIDLQIDAHQLPLRGSSVSCCFAINVFHHLNSPENFLHEQIRVLKPGGVCILIEPHNGFLSSFIHKNLHDDEYFDSQQADWTNSKVSSPMEGANQALGHIVFNRDTRLFTEKFRGRLEIIHQEYCSNSIRYLLSGGFTYRQIFPNKTENAIEKLERILKSTIRHWSLHQMTVIRRMSNAGYEGEC